MESSPHLRTRLVWGRKLWKHCAAPRTAARTCERTHAPHQNTKTQFLFLPTEPLLHEPKQERQTAHKIHQCPVGAMLLRCGLIQVNQGNFIKFKSCSSSLSVCDRVCVWVYMSVVGAYFRLITVPVCSLHIKRNAPKFPARSIKWKISDQEINT